MICKQCSSDRQSSFTSEFAIHFPGLKGLENPVLWVFPKLVVCLKCGYPPSTRASKHRHSFQFRQGDIAALIGRWTVTSASVRNSCLHLEVRLPLRLGKTASTPNVGLRGMTGKPPADGHLISSTRRTAWLQR